MDSTLDHSIRAAHVVPFVHALLVVAASSGYLIPAAAPLGMLFSFIVIVDFPVSIVYMSLAFVNGALAFAWLAVVGTLWWYFLFRTAEKLVAPYKGRK
jgi:hypothetical protein